MTLTTEYVDFRRPLLRNYHACGVLKAVNPRRVTNYIVPSTDDSKGIRMEPSRWSKASAVLPVTRRRCDRDPCPTARMFESWRATSCSSQENPSKNRLGYIHLQSSIRISYIETSSTSYYPTTTKPSRSPRLRSAGLSLHAPLGLVSVVLVDMPQH